MPVTAAVSAAATIGGAVISSNAAKSAAKTQANAATQAADYQKQMYDTTRSDLSPFKSLGQAALDPYARLLGISAPASSGGSFANANGEQYAQYLAANPDLQAEAQRVTADGEFPSVDAYLAWHAQQYPNEGRPLYTNQATAQSANPAPTNSNSTSDIEAQLQQLPGYQFQRDQGIASIARALGSQGQTGAQAKGIARFVTGLADSTYGAQVDRLNAAATLGENAAAQTGSLGVQSGANVGNSLSNAGTALASGQVGSANALSGGLSGLSNAYLTSRLFNGSIYGGGGSGVTNYGADANSDPSMAGLY